MTSISELKRRFSGRTTADQVLATENIKGKGFLVTGGTSGIGVATVESLAKAGAHVTFTGRNVQAADSLVESVHKNHPGAVVEFMPLDLCSFGDVKRFANEFMEKHQRLDCLIFNAGMLGGAYLETKDGYESAAQVNVLSQVYLMELIRPLLAKSSPSRVVFVSSDAHRMANVEIGKFTQAVLSPPQTAYGAWKQYTTSKLCQIAVASYLQQHWSKGGITFYSLHPGVIGTGIGRSTWYTNVAFKIAGLFSKSPQQGAATTVYCAAASDTANQGGKYWKDCWFCEPTSAASDPRFAEEVWKLSQDMIGAKVSDYVPSVSSKD